MVASTHAVNVAIPHKEAEQVNPGGRLPLREQLSVKTSISSNGHR
jgi:hypothetical protein